MTYKIITILGARPQFIKASVLSKKISEKKNLEEFIVHTGQHFDSNMSDIFFNELQIPKPFKNLNIGGGTHGENTGRMIEEVERLIFKLRPDLMIVYGDTDSTLAGAISAAKLELPIMHIEAGLRSFNRSMPEEINRVVADHLSNYLITPSEGAVTNLIKEGINQSKIYNFGDIMLESSLHNLEIASKHSKLLSWIEGQNNFYLLTIHRPENTNNKKNMLEIFSALEELNEKVIFPIHPRTKSYIERSKIKLPKNIIQVEPMGYFDFLISIKMAKKVITDSGGVQKESFFLNTPCITIRKETEWTELLDVGANILTNAKKEEILQAVKVEQTFSGETVYGAGNTSEEIVRLIINELSR